MIALVLYIVIPVLCLLGVKRRKEISNFLDMDATLTMRGVGMLFIVFTHMAAANVCPDTYFYYVSGVIGVGICFLVSGYGLHISYNKKPDYLKRFWLPKLLRLVLPFLMAYIIYWVLKVISGETVQLSSIINGLLTFTFPGTTLWYLKIQLMMYAAFYFSYRFITKRNIKIACVFALTVIYIVIAASFGLKQFWYNTCLFFPAGLLLAEYQERILSVIRRTAVFFWVVCGFIGIYGLLYLFGRMNLDFLIDTVYMLFFCAILLWGVQHFAHSIVLGKIGKYSIEVYLLHIVLSGPWSDATNPIAYLLVPLISVLVGIPVHYFSEKVTKALCKQRVLGG